MNNRTFLGRDDDFTTSAAVDEGHQHRGELRPEGSASYRLDDFKSAPRCHGHAHPDLSHLVLDSVLI